MSINISEPCLFTEESPNLAQVINTSSAGIWELAIKSKKLTWSAGFYRLLGYQPGHIACTYHNFIDHIIYYQDKKQFLKALQQPEAIIEIRLLTQTGYEWFESTTQLQAGDLVTGNLININERKLLELAAAANQESKELLKAATWSLDNSKQLLDFSPEAFELIQLEEPAPISVDEFISFYEPEQRPALTRAIQACRQYGRPFELDLQLRTVKNQLIWIKTKAVAHLDATGKCITINGVMQDIQLLKQAEQKLQSQNKRLHNFAHIVTHNLRSYATNLQAVINFHDEEEDEAERIEIFAQIKKISKSLTTTITQLNEVVKVDLVTEQHSEVNFETIFNHITNALQSEIQATGAIVNYDFSLCPVVYSSPVYLESILHNLLSNALKYRHPERPPVITCTCRMEEGHIVLTVADNGLGIDLERFGDKLFGLYQTFHTHADAHGIGLFITRNQVEALGGSIAVESTVNQGTTFRIKLN